MKKILRELINELKIQNRLLLMLYTHKAIGWDKHDSPANLFAEEKNKADQVLDLIKKSLEEE